jgi:hypothetical protein
MSGIIVVSGRRRMPFSHQEDAMRLRVLRRFGKLMLTIVLSSTILPFARVGVAEACEGGGEELPANLVFNKDPVKFAGNEKIPVNVKNTGGFAALTKLRLPEGKNNEGTKPKYQLYEKSGEVGVKNCTKSTNLAKNESCGLEVELVNFTGAEINKPTATLEIETSVADVFKDNVEK